MKTLINHTHFIKAVEFVGRNFFSKPYSLTPIVDRWFNQLAMIELENGTFLHLNGKIATQFIEIQLDGDPVSKEAIADIHRFYSKESTHEKDKKLLDDGIERLIEEIKTCSSSLEKKEKEDALAALREEVATYEKQKAEAKALYDAILEVKHGDGKPVQRGQAVLKEADLEAAYNSKIKKIIYRPNHGLTHSTRTAYMITALYAFKKEYNKAPSIDHVELEKLQMMMLFSIVGRRDETGFSNTGSNAVGRSVYEEYRAHSAKEFLKYGLDNLQHLYDSNHNKLYRDAIIVELMGYASIQDCLSRRKAPIEALITYVIKLEHDMGRVISRQDALTLITKKTYSLESIFPEKSAERTHANSQLEMMNAAHAIDLSRCYPFYATTPGGPKSSSLLNSYLNIANLFTPTPAPVMRRLTSVFELLRSSFDAMELTGQKTTYGLITRSEFEAVKEDLAHAVTAIEQRFSNPANFKDLLAEAMPLLEEIKSYYTFDSTAENVILDFYKRVVVLKETAKYLTKAKPLPPSISMFRFQNHEAGKPDVIDHHKNAIMLVNALEGLKPLFDLDNTFDRPLIAAVKHQRKENTVALQFKTRDQIVKFISQYVALFKTDPDTHYNSDGALAVNEQGMYSLKVDRKNYLQLRDDKLIQFEIVTPAPAVQREASLVDEHGTLEALNLIKRSRALGRLVSTMALKGESFPDYDYFLRALENPSTERYSKAPLEFEHFPTHPGKYFDPRSGAAYDRHQTNEPPPELKFQEPITEPVRLEDRMADGWKRHNKTWNKKNTIFTKKLAHTLLPPEGQMTPYQGYTGLKHNYFPIGILSDVAEVDLKDERYIWSQNMETFSKFWLRDISTFNKRMYAFLNARFDNNDQLVRYDKTQVIALDKAKLKKQSDYSSPGVLIKYLEQRQAQLVERLNNKHYRPTDETIKNFKELLQQERQEYLNQVKGNPDAQRSIKRIYAALKERLDQEAARKHPKYAISLRELIEHQKKHPGLQERNEILAANTRGAARALYTSTDELIYRLNLALHAMKIKEQYHYDVPLLILSETKPPRQYTEALIKADLNEACKLLQENKFPYDTTVFTTYETDAQGDFKLVNNKKVPKLDAQGREVKEPKNLKYQQMLLLDLFKLGLPELTDLTELETGKIKDMPLDDTKISLAIESIISQMNLIGGLARETKLMDSIFAQPDLKAKEHFFLRAVSLGHSSLIEALLERKDFKPDSALLNRALQLTHTSNDSTMKTVLINTQQKITYLQSMCAELHVAKNLRGDDLTQRLSKNLTQVMNMLEIYHNLKNQLDFPAELEALVHRKANEICLNSSSQPVQNLGKLQEFLKLLRDNEELKSSYIELIKSNQSVKIEQLIDAYHRLGDKATKVAMSIILKRGWEDGNNYLIMLELRKAGLITEKAGMTRAVERYGTSPDALSGDITILEQECQQLLEKIKHAQIHTSDYQTRDFCMAMDDFIESGKGDYVLINLALKKLEKAYEAVTSPEMKAINAQLMRLDKNAASLFGIGNKRKADRIRQAIAQVPLMERLHVFSGNSPASNQVQAALAAHRISPKNPIKANKVDESQAAQSYKEVAAVIKSKSKSQADAAESDTDANTPKR